jgi:diguanylate cyclase (GGDEF)-like protein
VIVPLTYSASVLFLILAAGGSSSGIGIVILIPLVWTALYHRRWESAVVVIGIVAVEIVVSLTPLAVSNTVLARRVLFWGAIGMLISIATHDLRDRVNATMVARDEAHRRTVSLVTAAEELTASLSPFDVLCAATRLAAEMTSPPGSSGRRAQYMRVNEGTVRLVAQYDEAGEFVAQSFPLSDHPHLEEVLRCGEPIQRTLDPKAVGRSVGDLIERLDLTHSIYVPVYRGNAIDGVLSVPTRGKRASKELFEHCLAIGHLTELALSNAISHEEIQELATTDALTGLPNRRGFHEIVENLPGRRPFGILAMDVDGLKTVNDTKGHAAGDALLAHIARTLKATLRRGDVMARLGGDEFAAFLFEADEDTGRMVAGRMMVALKDAPIDGQVPRVSAGLAYGLPGDAFEKVLELADRAMYKAKRGGGARYEMATEMVPDSPFLRSQPINSAELQIAESSSE